MGGSLRSELIEEIDELSGEQQGRLLALVRDWKSASWEGERPESLMALAGTLPKANAEEMRTVIEQECERIDHASW